MRVFPGLTSNNFLGVVLLACVLASAHAHGDHSKTQPQQAQQQQQQQQQPQQQQQQQHQGHNQQAQQHGGHATVPLHSAKHVQDKEHIKEHLKEQINVKDEQMSEKDLQFHYFKVHDSDNNDKLDGIELANAMVHYHDEETGEKSGDYSEEELASMVDQILDEDDLNKDGFIDYPEFIQSQEREESAE